MRHYNKTRRDIDARVLWPSCKETANGDVEHARCIFRVHAEIDPAWKDLTKQERELIISKLE